jgi:hypothetical protein
VSNPAEQQKALHLQQCICSKWNADSQSMLLWQLADVGTIGYAVRKRSWQDREMQ